MSDEVENGARRCEKKGRGKVSGDTGTIREVDLGQQEEVARGTTTGPNVAAESTDSRPVGLSGSTKADLGFSWSWRYSGRLDLNTDRSKKKIDVM